MAHIEDTKCSWPRWDILAVLFASFLGFYPQSMRSAQSSDLATNTVTLAKGYNFLGVMVRNGDNLIADLFPQAPPGTVIFSYDNATGYAAAEFLESEWSRPDLAVPVGQGVIIVSPDEGRAIPIVGEPVPAVIPRLFRGHQLIALTPELLGALPKQAVPGDKLVYREVLPQIHERWTSHGYDEFDATFLPWLPQSPPVGAAWYSRPAHAPVNPAGIFIIRPAIYVNNRSRAFDVNVPFRNPGFCGPGLAVEAFLFHVPWTRIGSVIRFDGSYIDPRQDLLRYLPSEGTLDVALRAGPFAFPSDADSFPVLGNAYLPTGLKGLRTIDFPFPLGNPFEGVKPFNLTLNVGQSGLLASSLGNDLNGDDWYEIYGATVYYQWERQSAQGWVEVPGAAATAYMIQSAEAEHAGRYRQRMRWGCREFYSDEVEIKVLGATARDLPLQISSALAIEFPTLPGQKYQLQTSEDLQTWTNLGTPIEGTGAPFKQSFSVRSPPQVTWRVQRLQ